MSRFNPINSIRENQKIKSLILSFYKLDSCLTRDVLNSNIKLTYVFFSTSLYHEIGSGTITNCAFVNALTSICPIAVSSTSKFIEEYPKDIPFWFSFTDVEDLVESLRKKEMLESLRNNMKKVHTLYSFESQSQRVAKFIEEVLTTSHV
jgi:hypothetical protein